jgi:hypothetical protein
LCGDIFGTFCHFGMGAEGREIGRKGTLKIKWTICKFFCQIVYHFGICARRYYQKLNGTI